MRFAILDFAGKGSYLRQKLVEAGHTTAEQISEADLLLLDCDWSWAHPRPEMIETAHSAGAEIALYPHGGLPTAFVYDGLTEPDPRVALRLEHGVGSVEMTRVFGADLDQHATGWLYSPTAPFTPVDDPKVILFAPLHPNIEAMKRGFKGNGHDPAPVINQRVYRELLETGKELVISHVGPIHRNGLWPHPRATFVANHEMSYPASYQLIAEADAVVAAGTLLAAAVASGKPTVGFGPTDCADYIDGYYQHATHADEYRSMADYPLDCTDGDLPDLLARACAGDGAVAEWRERWVGDDGTAAAIRLLEGVSLPVQAKSKSVTVEGATAVVNITAG